MPSLTENLSVGARELYGHLRFLVDEAAHKRAFPGQRYLARKFARTSRTIQRWVSELLRAGLVEVQRRYRRSNVYHLVENRQLSLFPAVENAVEKQAEPVSSVAIGVATVAALSSLRSQRQNMATPAAVVETRKTPLLPMLERLPEFVKRALQRARGRILRAQNPAAYAQSIISCEVNLAKWRAQQPKHKTAAPAQKMPVRSDREALHELFGAIPSLRRMA
jgi:hypothetical protein